MTAQSTQENQNSLSEENLKEIKTEAMQCAFGTTISFLLFYFFIHLYLYKESLFETLKGFAPAPLECSVAFFVVLIFITAISLAKMQIKKSEKNPKKLTAKQAFLGFYLSHLAIFLAPLMALLVLLSIFLTANMDMFLAK